MKRVIIVAIAVITIIVGVVIFSHTSGSKDEVVVSKETIEAIIKSAYTPESMDQYLADKEKYASIMTEEVSDAIYYADEHTVLTEDDLKRKIEMSSIEYSAADVNTTHTDLYRANFTLKTVSGDLKIEWVISLNTSGKIYDLVVNNK